MRLNKLFILYSLFGILMASCIKDEAPNAEADITGISFEEDVLPSLVLGSYGILYPFSVREIVFTTTFRTNGSARASEII